MLGKRFPFVYLSYGLKSWPIWLPITTDWVHILWGCSVGRLQITQNIHMGKSVWENRKTVEHGESKQKKARDYWSSWPTAQTSTAGGYCKMDLSVNFLVTEVSIHEVFEVYQIAIKWPFSTLWLYNKTFWNMPRLLISWQHHSVNRILLFSLFRSKKVEPVTAKITFNVKF